MAQFKVLYGHSHGDREKEESNRIAGLSAESGTRDPCNTKKERSPFGSALDKIKKFRQIMFRYRSAL